MKTNDGAFYRLNKHSEKIFPTGVHDTRFAYQQRHLLLEQRAGVIWLAGGRQLVRIEEELEGQAQDAACRSLAFHRFWISREQHLVFLLRGRILSAA